MPPPLQVDLQPTDLEWCPSRVTCDVGFLCANFSLPRPLLFISTWRHYMYIFVKMSTLYRCPVFNVITVVVYRPRNKNTFTTDAFFVQNTDVAVFYYCLLFMNSIIILST